MQCEYARDPMGYGQKDERCVGCKWRAHGSIKRLLNPQYSHAAIMDAGNGPRHLIAGAEMEITVKRATRNTKQNALLHAMLTDIAMQHEWAGKLRDVECWKRLLTAAWLRTRGEPLEMLPAVDGVRGGTSYSN